MGLALQVLLLAVAIVVAVAGIGVALALRMTGRQRARKRRAAVASSLAVAREKGARNVAAGSALRSRDRSLAANPPLSPTPAAAPEDAHQARLQALQALLALGDAKAEEDAESGHGFFADTQPLEEQTPQPAASLRASTPVQSPLLHLDEAPRRH